LREEKRRCEIPDSIDLIDPTILRLTHAMGPELFHHRPPDPSDRISAPVELCNDDPLSVSGGGRRSARVNLFGPVDHRDPAF